MTICRSDMKLISFSMTIHQFRNRSKRVTRRLGWEDLKIGETLIGIEKGQGLKKGEKVVRLGPITIKEVDREPISAIIERGQTECDFEGFPNLTPEQFVRMFCVANVCKPDRIITRIAFEYLDPPGSQRTVVNVIKPAEKWPFPTEKA